MRKLTTAALISLSMLSFGASAAFPNALDMYRCNGGPLLSADDLPAASGPNPPQIAGVNQGCLGDLAQMSDRGRERKHFNLFRRSSRDSDVNRDIRGYAEPPAE